LAERFKQKFTVLNSVAFATEAPYLKDLGMDTIILGPGNIAQAHQPDEFYNIKEFANQMIDILTQMIRPINDPKQTS
jgi:acetylornithine deacetylase